MEEKVKKTIRDFLVQNFRLSSNNLIVPFHTYVAESFSCRNTILYDTHRKMVACKYKA